MTGLSDEDREELVEGLRAGWDRRVLGLPPSEWATTDEEEVGLIVPAVELIVARHVREAVVAALTEAAEEVEDARSSHVYRCGCTECRISERAAQIVRARIPT